MQSAKNNPLEGHVPYPQPSGPFVDSSVKPPEGAAPENSVPLPPPQNLATKDARKQSITCPITQQIFHTPVMTCCGHTFEKEAIEQVTNCPSCKIEISGPYAINYAVKSFVDDFLTEFKEERSDQYAPVNPDIPAPLPQARHYQEEDRMNLYRREENLHPQPVVEEDDLCCCDPCDCQCPNNACDPCLNLSLNGDCCAADCCAADCDCGNCLSSCEEAALPCLVVVGVVAGAGAVIGAFGAAVGYTIKEMVVTFRQGEYGRGTLRTIAAASAGYGAWILSEGIATQVAQTTGIPESKHMTQGFLGTMGMATGMWLSSVRLSRHRNAFMNRQQPGIEEENKGLDIERGRNYGAARQV